MYNKCISKTLYIKSLHILKSIKTRFCYTSDMHPLYTKLGAIWVLEIWEFRFLFLSLHPNQTFCL